MRRLSELLFVLLVAASARAQSPNTAKSAAPARPAPPERADIAKSVQSIIDRTNQFRIDEKLPKVVRNSKLTKTAQNFADWMAKNHRYGHEADGKKPAERATAQGYDYCLVLENIAYQYSSAGFATDELAEKFFQGWKESEGHRKNLLDPDVTETGVAIARGSTGYYFAVQLFGRPKSAAIEFTILNRADIAIKYKIGDEDHELEPRHSVVHTRCRPSDVRLSLPKADPKAEPEKKTIRPTNGQRWLIAGEKGAYQVRKE